MSDDDLDLSNESQDEPENEDGPDNVAEKIQTERKAQRIDRERRERVEFWKGIFGSKVGRREMWGILQAGHWNETKFAVGPNGFPQVEATWFAAGEQALAKRLHDTWDIIDHEGVYKMKTEFDSRYGESKPLRKKAGE